MFRKCGLFALSFAVLSTSFSVLFSDVSNAASDKDDFYRSTRQIKVGTEGYTSSSRNCEIVDWTDDWYSRILDSSVSSAAKTSLQNAINNGGRWGVTQTISKDNENTGNRAYGIVVFWTENDSLYLDWSANANSVTAYGGAGGIKKIEINKVALFNSSGGGLCDDRYTYSSSSTRVSNKESAQGSNYINLFLWIKPENLNLPSGYAGTIPPDSQIDTREVLKPDFRYSVNDKKLQATDYDFDLPSFEAAQNPDYPNILYYNDGFHIEWVLHKCEGSEQFTNCTSEQLMELENLPQASTFEETVSTYGKYELRASYTVKQCMRYPSYPATPDSCYYAKLSSLDELNEYRFLDTVVTLDIDGGSIIGDTKLDNCDEYGYCVKDKVSGLLDYFEERDDFGLTALLLSPILFYQQLPAMADNCDPISYQFLDETLELPCMMPMYQSWSPFVLGLYQSVINALVAYAVGLGLFRTIKGINDPENDRIEVKEL